MCFFTFYDVDDIAVHICALHGYPQLRLSINLTYRCGEQPHEQPRAPTPGREFLP